MRLVMVGILAMLSVTAAIPPQIATAQQSCTSGSSGIGDGYYPYMGNSGYDAGNYDLDLELDVDAGAIRSGTATMTALAETALCRFNLDFNGLDIDGITVDGSPASWRRDGQELTIEPSRPIAAGAEFVVETRYHGTPFAVKTSTAAELEALFAALATPGAIEAPDLATPVDADVGEIGPPDSAADAGDGILILGSGMDVERYGPSMGGWWTATGQIFVAGEPRGAETWFPVNGHPADKATYTLRLTVDEPYDVASNGVRVSLEQQDGKRTATWVAEDPMASYLVTLYAGDIDIVTAAMDDGPALRYAYGAAVAEWQRAQLENLTPRVIRFFDERFGNYPFSVAGAMVVDGSLWFALETQTIPIHGIQIEAPEFGFTRDQIDGPLEEQIVHELAHQWFGDAVSPLRWRDVYLNEGLTQYATYLWLEERDGREVMDERMRSLYERMSVAVRFSDPAFRERATGKDLFAALGDFGELLAPEIQAAVGAENREAVDRMPLAEVFEGLEQLGFDPEGVTGPPPVLTGDPGPNENFSALWVYERGALATHALRVAIGDEAFFRVLRVWVERHGNGSATIQDFIALSEQESGVELDPLFDAWLFQRTMPPFPDDAARGPMATPEAEATPVG